MKRALLLTVSAGACAAVVVAAKPAFAHHSFAATYFEDKTEDHRLRLRSIQRPSDGWKWGGNFD